MDDLEMRRGRAKIKDVREQRNAATPFELREAKGGDYILEGYASTWEPYDCYGGVAAGGWVEQLDRRAFDKTLDESPDLQLLINHEGMPLARTKSGTLELNTDRAGLRVRAYLDPTDPDVQALLPKMRRGDLDEMSFAFRVKDQEWNNDYSHRNITEVSLQKGDVSVVNYGMNPTTKASIMVPSAIEALAHVTDKELAECRKLPSEELDSAIRTLLSARGFIPGGNRLLSDLMPADKMSIDELDVALAARYNTTPELFKRAVLTVNDVRALEDDKKKPDDTKPDGSDPDEPDDDDKKPGDKGNPSAKKRDGMDDDEELAANDDHPDDCNCPMCEEKKSDGMDDDEDEMSRADEPKKPYGNVPYADPGYQKDGKKRYPIDTEAHAKAAWSYINQAKNQDGYTPEQVASIKAKVKQALKKFGVDVAEEKNSFKHVRLREENGKLFHVAVFDDGTELRINDDQAAQWRNATSVGANLGTQRLNLGGDQGEALEGTAVTKDEGDAQDNTTPGGTDAEAADEQLITDTYCPQCGEPHSDGKTCAEHNAEIMAQLGDLAAYSRTIGDQDPKDPKKKKEGADGDEDDDDTPDGGGSPKRSIADEIIATTPDPLEEARQKAREADEEDPRKRNYSLSRALQELMDDKGEGPQGLRDAAVALSEFRDYSEPEPEPDPQPEPEKRDPSFNLTEAWRELRGGDVLTVEQADGVASQELETPEEVLRIIDPPPPEPEPEPEPPPPALRMDEAWQQLREGESTLDVEVAELAAAQEIETPETVERLMQPAPEPEPEPEPDPIDVRAELDRFKDEDRKRYSLDEALARASELVDPDPDSPTTTGVEAGWEFIDQAGKPFLRKDGVV